MSVFKVDKDFNVIVNIDAVKLVPELSNLSQEELRYVIMVVDYVDGPFRKKPLEERKLLAKKKIFGDIKHNPEIPKVQIAMDAYKSLVFDIRRETIDIYTGKIKELQKESITKDITFQKMKEIDTSIGFMTERISKINKELDIDESEEIEVKGKKRLSYIEIWQRNQREYGEYKTTL